MGAPGVAGAVGHLGVALDLERQMTRCLTDLADAGKTIQEAIAAKPTADLDATWGKGFFTGGMFTRVAYDGLVKHRAAAAK